ncbi:unannotated protein [freshwater metagenome]|jgi:hypothetical protein|uniref:Unannotated protein n=1 Tax=freshwater metagenome TaxID=449393 RepID=A0A6J7Q7U7_9ZZZZ|nr:hypothetical protein [Actinomycetota bacterium]MSV94324.1 hypothetical protein [Actinomycetota bacterium]MSW60474.1 hypothetical protein [Actinomycetota bacterium]MSY45496.1 hypothetical protein [Actinomycetota bacterium]
MEGEIIMMKTRNKTNIQTEPITRSDIEDKLREIQSGLNVGGDVAKGPSIAAGIGVVLVVILVAYFFGRRSGKNKRSFIEIRRR